MSRADDFIRDARLPDIEYRTDVPEEVVCPSVTTRDSVAVVYLHNEREASDKGFVPVAEFLRRLARREPNLAVTGYRANGRQTTISFNKTDRVSLSPRLQAHLSTLAAQRDGKSAAVVAFLANLMPLYTPENRDGVWCALAAGRHPRAACGRDRVGRAARHRPRALAGRPETRIADRRRAARHPLERYVRLHGTGASEEAIAAELWHMARHFHFKTGCDVYLPQLPEPPHPLVRAGRTAMRMGEGVLVNLISKLTGMG